MKTVVTMSGGGAKGGFDEGPKRMICFKDMLFPQCERDFRSISTETWNWLQGEAKKRLEQDGPAHPGVVAHWKSIADGRVPFGFTVSAE